MRIVNKPFSFLYLAVKLSIAVWGAWVFAFWMAL